MSQHSELEPCPYCGGNASLSKIGRDWYRIAADHVTGCPLEDFQLDCPQSDDQLPLLLHDWNTRVDRTPSNNAEKCDQLRAEVAGLRTGYEAYERVNAELKAEVEALRKDADRYRWLRDSDYAGKILRDMGAKYRADADQRIDAALGQGEQS